LVMGIVYRAMGDLGRLVLQLLLVFLALDINFDAIVASVGTFVIGLLLRRRILPFLGIASAVVLATGLAGIGIGAGPTRGAAEAEAAVSPVSGPPVLVHLILDEHIGVEGLLGDEPEIAAMRQRLRDFYVGQGFRLFGGAYSEYLHTVNAIP